MKTKIFLKMNQFQIKRVENKSSKRANLWWVKGVYLSGQYHRYYVRF